LNNKKSVVGVSQLFWTVFIIFILVMVILIRVIGLGTVSESAIIPKDVEEYTLISRFYNSENCFAYQDEITGRVYPKTIDLSKFTEENMNKCFQSQGISYAFSLSLKSESLKDVNPINTDNWYKGPSQKEFVENVLVKDQDMIHKYVKLTIKVKNV